MPDDKMGRLVQTLLKKTAEGKVTWEATSAERQFGFLRDLFGNGRKTPGHGDILGPGAEFSR